MKKMKTVLLGSSTEGADEFDASCSISNLISAYFFEVLSGLFVGNNVDLIVVGQRRRRNMEAIVNNLCDLFSHSTFAYRRDLINDHYPKVDRFKRKRIALRKSVYLFKLRVFYLMSESKWTPCMNTVINELKDIEKLTLPRQRFIRVELQVNPKFLNEETHGHGTSGVFRLFSLDVSHPSLESVASRVLDNPDQSVGAFLLLPRSKLLSLLRDFVKNDDGFNMLVSDVSTEPIRRFMTAVSALYDDHVLNPPPSPIKQQRNMQIEAVIPASPPNFGEFNGEPELTDEDSEGELSPLSEEEVNESRELRVSLQSIHSMDSSFPPTPKPQSPCGHEPYDFVDVSPLKEKTIPQEDLQAFKTPLPTRIEIDAATQKMPRRKKEALVAKVRVMEKRMSALESQLVVSSTNVVALNKELDLVRGEKKQLGLSLKDHKMRTHHLQKEVNRLQDRITGVLRFEKENTALEQKNKELKARISELKREKTKLSRQKKRQFRDYGHYADENEQLMGENEQLRRLVTQLTGNVELLQRKNLELVNISKHGSALDNVLNNL
ncbi:hypothetical protein PCE1_002309 [Barthelona sp. PCE]